VIFDHLLEVYPIRDPTALLLQIVEEVGELAAAYSRGKGSVTQELGDVFNLVLLFSHSIGFDPSDLGMLKHIRKCGYCRDLQFSGVNFGDSK
jgi:hypothetical protein